jgi:hypothetical protein
MEKKKVFGFCCTEQGKKCSEKEIQQWKNKYSQQLRGEKNDKGLGDYHDPDCSHSSSLSDYYILLKKFLTVREEHFKKKLNGYFKYEFCSQTPSGIKVYECKNGEKNCLFTLRSDLFGFSAPKLIWKNITNKQSPHPYDVYLKTFKHDDEDKINTAIEKVVNWILYSRSIGGVFLWPIWKCGRNHQNQYNIARGGTVCIGETNPNYNYYIQDRVDLTLLEIKHSYDNNYANNYSNDKLYKYYIDEKTHMKQWLKHFGNFQTYVEFFMFDDQDMNELNSEIKYGENSFIDQKTLMPFDIVCHNSNCCVEDNVRGNNMITENTNIGTMCEDLVKKIMSRTEKMLYCIENGN